MSTIKNADKQLIYGIRKSDNRMVSIYDLADDMIGLRCNCVCAVCKRELQACSLKETNRRQRYFRHHTETKNGTGGGYCDANSANETALHQMAKQIIATEKCVFAPPKNISPREAGVAGLPKSIENDIERQTPYVINGKMVMAQSVALETRVNDFIPDAIIKTEKGEMLVEIRVNHKVDGEKEKKIEMYGAATIEVDLSEFLESPISTEDLRKIITSEAERKRWVFYPLSEKSRNNALQHYESLEQVKRHRQKETNRARRNGKLTNLFVSTNYEAALRSLRNDTEFTRATKEQLRRSPWWFDFGVYFKSHKSVPFFIDIPIAGEMVFQCDRRIWQSVIFNRFVYGRKEGAAICPVDDIFNKLRDEHKIKVDIDLTYKLQNPKRENESIWLRRSVVFKYLEYLETLGFVTPEGSSGWRNVTAVRTIVPPRKEASDSLQSALRSVNSLSPDIDELVHEKMRGYHERQREKTLKDQRERIARWEAKEEAKKLQRQQEDEKRKREADEIKAQKQKAALERILQFDYDHSTDTIYDLEGYRMVKCCSCGKIQRGNRMRKINTPNINTGYCCVCYGKNK